MAQWRSIAKLSEEEFSKAKVMHRREAQRQSPEGGQMVWSIVLCVATCLILIFRGSDWEGSKKRWQVAFGVFEAGIGVAGLISVSVFMFYKAFWG